MGSYDRYASHFTPQSEGPGADRPPPSDADPARESPDAERPRHELPEHEVVQPVEEPGPGRDAGAAPPPEQELLGRERPGRRSRDPRKKLSRWVEKRATRIVGKVYEDRAEDLEHRAARTIGSLYEERADELEDRAVRAMRRAIEAEADRIRIAIEHGVEVKKREVRLSLLVLVASSLTYVVLYFLTR